MFSCIGISCDREEKEYDYSLSKSSSLLNEKISKVSFNESFDSISLNNLNNFYRKETDKAVIINTSGDVNAYYTCGYINKKAVKILDKIKIYKENQYFDEFTGKEEYVRKYNIAIQKEKINEDKYPIIWFEIQKSEEVPNEIEDLVLLIVLQSKSIKYQEVSDSFFDEEIVIKEDEIFFEDKSFYDENYSKTTDKFLLDGEYLFFINKDELQEEKILIPFELDLIKNYESFEVEYRLNNKYRYINTEKEYMIGETDLRDIVDYYINNQGDYSFYVEEFLKALKEEDENSNLTSIEKTYPISEKNILLNEKSQKVNHLSSVSMILPDLDLGNFNERYDSKAYSGFIVSQTSQVDDYYTCGYVSNDIKDTLNSIIAYGKNWIGRNYYISKYNLALTSGKISSDEYPIIWYEIPKSEKIPKEIDGKFLVMITESRDFTISDLEGNIVKYIKLFFENKELYDKKLSDSNERYKFLISNKEYLVFRNENSSWNDEIIIEISSLIEPTSSGFKMKYYDNVAYVNVGTIPIYNENDLRLIYDYKNEKIGVDYYYFKLKDIIEILFD